MIGWLISDVKVNKCVNVFLRICMLLVMWCVRNFRMLFVILIFGYCFRYIVVLVWRMLICSLKLVGCRFMIRLYWRWDLICFFRFLILFGVWFVEMMICLCVLISVLKVWKNFFCVLFLLVINWILLIISMLIEWNICLKLIILWFFRVEMNLYMNCLVDR